MPTGYRIKKAWYRSQCRARGGCPPVDSVSAKYEYRITSVVAHAASIDEYARHDRPSPNPKPRARSGNSPVTPHTIAYRLNTCMKVVKSGARTTPMIGEESLAPYALLGLVCLYELWVQARERGVDGVVKTN